MEIFLSLDDEHCNVCSTTFSLDSCYFQRWHGLFNFVIILILCRRASVLPKQLPQQGSYWGDLPLIAFPQAVVRAGITNLAMVPPIGHPLFAKDTMEVFIIHQLMSVSGSPSLTSIRGTTYTLMIHPVWNTRMTVYHWAGIQTHSRQLKVECAYLEAILSAQVIS